MPLNSRHWHFCMCLCVCVCVSKCPGKAADILFRTDSLLQTVTKAFCPASAFILSTLWLYLPPYCPAPFELLHEEERDLELWKLMSKFPSSSQVHSIVKGHRDRFTRSKINMVHVKYWSIFDKKCEIPHTACVVYKLNIHRNRVGTVPKFLKSNA